MGDSPIRHALKAVIGERGRYEGTFVAYGNLRNRERKTFLLKDIRRVGETEILTDHLWFRNTRDFQRYMFLEGDVIQFNAMVTTYKKGFFFDEFQDYELSNPYKIRLIIPK